MNRCQEHVLGKSQWPNPESILWHIWLCSSSGKHHLGRFWPTHIKPVFVRVDCVWPMWPLPLPELSHICLSWPRWGPDMYAISNHTQVVSLPSFHVCQKGDVGHNCARWHLLSGKYFNWFYMSVKQFCSFSKLAKNKC